MLTVRPKSWFLSNRTGSLKEKGKQIKEMLLLLYTGKQFSLCQINLVHQMDTKTILHLEAGLGGQIMQGTSSKGF